MVKWLLLSLAVVGFPASAFSEDESHRPTSDAANAESPDQLKEDHEESVADYIFHHVSDSNELEFEIPLSQGKNPVIHLPVIRVPLKEGACPADRNKKASLAAGCLDLSITKHTVMMWLAGALLLLGVLLGSNRDKRNLVSHGTIANLWEMAVLFVRDELAIKNIGPEEGPRYTPYLLSVFFFILFMNLLGLFPWMSTATSNLAITLGLALCTFILTQVAGIRSAGLGVPHCADLPSGNRGDRSNVRAVRDGYLFFGDVRRPGPGLRLHHAFLAFHRHGGRDRPSRRAWPCARGRREP